MSIRSLLVAGFVVSSMTALPVSAQTNPSTAASTIASMTSTVRIEAVDASTSTLWFGNERVAFGLGQHRDRDHDRGPSLATPTREAQRTMGVAVTLTPWATVSFESDARALRSHDAWIASDQHRVGLSFRTTSPSRDVKSLLTVQLSGQSVLQLRPRGGGLRVIYSATF